MNRIIVISFLSLGILGTLLLVFNLEKSQSRIPSKSRYTKKQISTGRATWRREQRGGKVDPNKVIAARNQVKKMYQSAKAKRDAGLNKWEFLGPPAVGGRVRALAIHPNDGNILYAGGASGGIFKSTDAAGTWTPLDDFLPSLSISSIIVNPNNPSILYASTGEGITGGMEPTFSASSPGAGIFKSEDAGETWNLVNALNPDNLEGYHWINSLAFDPTNPNIFYAAGYTTNEDFSSYGGAVLYKFKFGGDSVATLPINPSNAQATKVYVNPGDRDNIFLCLSSGLQVSYDRGSTWANQDTIPGFIANSGRVEVAMSASNDSTVYALLSGSGLGSGISVGSILRSTDKGVNWTTQITGLDIFYNGTSYAGGYHNVIWVDPEDVEHLLVGGIDLWRSITSGTSIVRVSDWTRHDDGKSAHADQHVIVAAKNFNTSSNPKIYVGNDGGIARANNYQTLKDTVGWQILNEGLNITQFYSSDIDGNNAKKIIAGAQDNGTWETDDFGASWIKSNGGDGGYCAFSKQANDPVYSSIQFGVFEATYPPNIGFRPHFDLGSVDQAPFIAEMEIYPNEGTKILVGGENLWQVTHTPFGARNKQISPRVAKNGEYITAIEISEDSSQILVGYKDGDVYRSLDGSNGPWVQCLGLGTVEGYKGGITDIALHPSDADKFVVTVGGYQDENIWYTDDGANTWEERSDGIPALHINCITWHPDIGTWLYVGTDMGIMASENSGQSWNVKPSNGQNDGPAIVEISKLQFTQNNSFGSHWLVATTYGRGIWKTEFIIRKNVYLDEDCVNCGPGTSSEPFELLEEAVERQAHGQVWTFDGGSYPLSGKVVIDRNIGKIKTENEEVIKIGN